MLCIYGLLLQTPHDDDNTRAPLLETVRKHSQQNDNGYPVNIRWQALLDELLSNGLLRQPHPDYDSICIDPNQEVYAVACLPDGTPAGITIRYDERTPDAVSVFRIPEQHFRDALEDTLRKGTLLLPDNTRVTLRDANGKPERIELLSLRRDTPSGHLLVRYRNQQCGENEDYANDLAVADIYQILLAIQN